MLYGNIRDNCCSYLYEPGNELEGLKPMPRLHLRAKDNDFFNKYIQNLKLAELIALNSKDLPNESQMHIKENCALLIQKIKSTFGNDETKIANFCRFLVTRCYLVTVCTDSEQSAFRIFSVMNSRGLNLMPIDIIKSKVIGQIDIDNRQKYTDKWEELEIMTSRSGFNDVFTHTRMIYAKTKSKLNLLEEFENHVLSKVTPEQLIDDILTPYAEAYKLLKSKKYISDKKSEEINRYLFWLNKIDNSDWMPSAIKFISEHKNNPDYVLWFVKKLERLTAFLHITAKDVNKRIERYKELLEEMESNPDNNLNDPLTSIELTNEEKKEFVTALNSEVYNLTAVRRNYIILRLNEFVGDDAAKLDFEPNILTIEHVLPRTVLANSEWASWWPDLEERNYWLNRIANLVPLTRKKNSSAQNKDFSLKKDIYFKGKNGTTTYPLTTQVICESLWKPSTVEKRQQDLLDIFIKSWELKYIDSFLFQENYPHAFELRNKLCNVGIIVNNIFQKDYSFDSISLAASIVLGRSASGPKEWCNENNISYEQCTNSTTNNGAFNINDESTYGALSTGSLAYELFKRIFEIGNISDEEIKDLKTKEYSKQLFSKTAYPILADSREQGKRNSNKFRYKKEPIIYKGNPIYITTQWYKENMNDVISWYKRHL